MLNKIRSLFTSQGQAAVIAMVNAILGLLVAFNVSLTEAQLGAVLAAVNGSLAILVILFGPTVSVQAKALKGSGE